QAPEDADGQVTAGVAGLLGRRRDGVEADVGEEDHPRPAEDAAPAEGAVFARVGGMNGSQLRALTKAAPAAMNTRTTATLTITITALTLADSLMPTTSSPVIRAMISTAGRLNQAPVGAQVCVPASKV